MDSVQQQEISESIASIVFRKLTSEMKYPNFESGNVPVEVVARIMQKDKNWVRDGIEEGWLPIGICTKGKEGVRNFYISPKKFWEETGFVWKGENK